MENEQPFNVGKIAIAPGGALVDDQVLWTRNAHRDTFELNQTRESKRLFFEWQPSK
jgi:hypothetical protein